MIGCGGEGGGGSGEGDGGGGLSGGIGDGSGGGDGDGSTSGGEGEGEGGGGEGDGGGELGGGTGGGDDGGCTREGGGQPSEAEAASFFFRSLCRRGCVQFDLHLAHFGSRTILELVGVDDDVQRADLCQPELLVLDAARVDDERLLVQLRADGDWRCRTCRSC